MTSPKRVTGKFSRAVVAVTDLLTKAGSVAVILPRMPPRHQKGLGEHGLREISDFLNKGRF